MPSEEYKLKVDRNNIIITGRPAGIFYGVQSLRQIIKSEGNSRLVVPSLIINDRPRFGWRAFLLDEGRYFKGEKVVKDLLDEMALLKMNRFHWHLTDDQGWRCATKAPKHKVLISSSVFLRVFAPLWQIKLFEAPSLLFDVQCLLANCVILHE